MRDTIITLVLLLLIAGGGWAWLKYGAKKEAIVITPEELKMESERLRQYRQLNNLEPDLSIVENSVFKSLKSVSAGAQATSTVRGGRPNPFAPL